MKGLTGQVNGAAYSPDGKRVVTASRDGNVGLWDTRSGALLRTLATLSLPVTALGFDPMNTPTTISRERSVQSATTEPGATPARCSR